MEKKEVKIYLQGEYCIAIRMAGNMGKKFGI